MPTQIIRTTCTMDCPDTCGLEVTVADGKIQRIRGTQDHPITNGFICDKIARFDRRVYHEDRLLSPMRRSGQKGTGEFIRISWDEAIAEITNRFKSIIQQWGGEAILPYHYGGSNGLLGDKFLDDLYFATLGASRMAKTLCAAPSTEVAMGMYDRMPGVAFEDYPQAKCIVIWGANPKATNIHLVPLLRQAKKNGTFIATVNPVQTFSTQEADLHLPIFPGADLPVALAMIRLWKEAGQLDLNFLRRQADGLAPLLQQADMWPVERAAAEARVAPQAIRTLAQVYAETMQKVAAALQLDRQAGDPSLFAAGKTQGYDFPGPTPIQFQTTFPRTPDRKIHLTPAALGKSPFHYQPVKKDGFPLALVSPSNNKMISSSLGEFNYPELWLTIHPADATARQIADGDTVRVFNELGEVVCRAQVSARIREGVVSLPKGAWRKSSLNGLTATALCPADVNVVGGGACFNDARVEVERKD